MAYLFPIHFPKLSGKIFAQGFLKIMISWEYGSMGDHTKHETGSGMKPLTTDISISLSTILDFERIWQCLRRVGMGSFFQPRQVLPGIPKL